MTHPHDPYAIPQAYWDRYQDREIADAQRHRRRRCPMTRTRAGSAT